MESRSIYQLLILFLLMLVSFARADEYDGLRLKWRDIIVGTGYDVADPNVADRLTAVATTANSNWSSMEKSTTRTFLWSDLASTSISSDITNSYHRLRAMALAYATPGCSLAGDSTLLADIIGGLDWMDQNRYNPSKAIYNNWWDFEIGTPYRLMDIVVLLYDHLTVLQRTRYTDAVNKFTPSATTPAAGGTTGSFTGANRMWKIRVVAVRGAVVKDSSKLASARDAFSNLFVYVTTGDGFYRDGSFIQHGEHPYTAGYGASLIETMTPVLRLLSGSSWAVTDPAQANLYQWIFDSYEPIIYNGNVFDLVRGREAGRASATPNGHGMMNSILEITRFAPPAEGMRMKRMVKHWAQQDHARNFIAGRPLTTLDLAKSLMNDSSIAPRGELVAHYTFPEMDRVIHLGAGYGFGLSMCSSRIANFESINGENLRGWFTGDGQTTLYNGDLLAFSDAYWATVDPYRLPGVTADVNHVKLPHQAANIGPRAQGQDTLSPHSWVGGATLGNYGAAGMQFKGVGVSLTGKKSWFMFDDEIVCLGAGITSTDSRPIETTVEQRKINSSGDNLLIVNGLSKPNTLGWTEAIPGTSWMHLAGHAGGSDIGYYFPTKPSIQAVRESRTGAWSEIDSDGSTSPITRNYLRLGIEHGGNPVNATYQYVLLPGRNARRTGQYAATPQITVLNNNANVQAVRENTLGITAVNFWTDNSFTYGGITSNKKACVIVRNDGPFIDLSVSDPTHLNPNSIELEIALDGGTLVSEDTGVTVTQTSPTIRLTVNTANSGGRTFKARFYKLPPEVVNLAPVADSYVYDKADSVDMNFGEQDRVIVKKAEAGFNREGFMRFDVPVASGVLLGASLKLRATTSNTPGVHALAKVEDNGWSETSITWNNKPAGGGMIGTWTPALNAESSVDVVGALPTSGPVSFKVQAITETSNGIVFYGSRENALAENRPQLTLLYGHIPPEVSLRTPADGDVVLHSNAVVLSADATATDGSITRVDFYDGGVLLGSDSSFPYGISAPIPGGARELTAVAVDANGLSRTSLVNRVDVYHPPMANMALIDTPKGVPIDIDLNTLVSDVETPQADLRLQLGTSSNGSVTLLPDGQTARFTPVPGYHGDAGFRYTVIDTSRDERTILNYAFQNSDVSDSSGQGRNATLNVQGNGAVSYLSDSPFADYPGSIALIENGTAGAVRIDRSLGLGEVDLANGEWTIAGWFKRNSSTNIDVIVQLGSSGSFGPSALTLAFYGSGNTLELRNFTSSNVQDVGLSKSNVANNSWHHFAIVRDGNGISWYHNGVLVGSDESFALAFNNSQPVKFGGSGNSTVTDRWLNGSLADLAIFNRAHTESDVARLVAMPVRWFGGLSASANITVDVLSALDSWRLIHFGTTHNTGQGANDADADADGVSNFLEFSLGTDPGSPTTSPVTIAKDGPEISFIYQRSVSAMAEVNFFVEWSDHLLPPWSGNWVTETILSDNGILQIVKAKVPAGSLESRFVRLRVGAK
jgi:hyaluronate lyase